MNRNNLMFCFYVALLSALPCYNSFTPTTTLLVGLPFNRLPCHHHKSTATTTTVIYNDAQPRNPTTTNGKQSNDSNIITLQNQNIHYQKPHDQNFPSLLVRRRDLFDRSSSLLKTAVTTTAIIAATSTTVSAPAKAASSPPPPSRQIYTRVRSDKQGNKFGYTLNVDPTLEPSNKPLQTHLDEVNLLCPAIRGFQFGVTVDMIRLKNLREFGTPEEVGAKIVMAELKRDGVLDVTMSSDPSEDVGTGAYDVEYTADGTRGKKHYITRTVVRDGKLFVLTAQVKEADLDNGEVKIGDVWDVVRSFRVLGVDEME